MGKDQAPVLPSTVRVRFRPYLCDPAGGDWSKVPATYDLDADLADAGLEVTLGSGATHAVRDACHAIFPAAGGADPTNKAALQTLADRIARDFWSWRTVAYDRAYVGLATPALDGTVDSVTWTHRGATASTRLRSAPIGGEPARLAHADPEDDCPNCVGVFPTEATVAGSTVSLPRAKLCYEGGELVLHRGSPLTFPGCCSAVGPCCTTFPCGLTWDQIKGLTVYVYAGAAEASVAPGGDLQLVATPAHYVGYNPFSGRNCTFARWISPKRYWNTQGGRSISAQAYCYGGDPNGYSCVWSTEVHFTYDDDGSAVGGGGLIPFETDFYCPAPGSPLPCPVRTQTDSHKYPITTWIGCEGKGDSGPYTAPPAPAAAQAIPPLAASPHPPAGRPSVAESMRLLRAAKACPHRTAPSCGCPQVPGACALGKGGSRGVTLDDCRDCVRDDRATVRGHLSGYTGYGQLAAEVGRGLEALGVPVAFEAIDREDGGFIPLDEFVKGRIIPE